MALFPWLPRSLFAAEKGIPSIPPARAFAWDISRKGNTLSQEVDIREFDSYDIILAFGDLNASDENGKLHPDKARDSSWRKSYGEYVNGHWTGPFPRFLGSMGRHYYTKDTNTLVIARTLEELNQRDEMRQRGELISRPADPGIEIPIRLVVERLYPGKPAIPVFDSTTTTTGNEGNNLGFAQRFIVQGLKLETGVYRIHGTTLRDIAVPTGIGTYLAIPLRDWKISRPKR
jgi:hypothetical protein